MDWTAQSRPYSDPVEIVTAPIPAGVGSAVRLGPVETGAGVTAVRRIPARCCRVPAVGRDPRHDVLFESLSIGPKTLRNRFYQVPHSTGFGSDRPGAQARFRSMAAEGGWAAVCVELTSIAAESDRASLPVPVRLWDDDDAANLALVCEAAHRHGALAGVELWHGGVNVDRVPGGRRR